MLHMNEIPSSDVCKPETGTVSEEPQFGLLDIVEDIAGVKVQRHYNLDAPQGVRGRNSDNTEIQRVLGWEPEIDLRTGMEKTYHWIKEQYERRKLGESVVQ